MDDILSLMDYSDTHLLVSGPLGIHYLDKNTGNLESPKPYRKDYKSSPHLYGRFFQSSDGCIYLFNDGGEKGVYKSCPSYDYVDHHPTDWFVERILTTDYYLHYFERPSRIVSQDLRTKRKVSYSFNDEITHSIKAIIDLGGDTILFADFSNIYKYHPSGYLKRMEKFVIPNTHRYESLLKDSKGDLWTGRQRNGIYIWSDSGYKLLDKESKPNIVYQDYIECIYEDQDKDIWIATEQGWTRYDRDTETTHNYPWKEISHTYDVRTKKIIDITQTVDGDIWMTDANQGILRWDKYGDSLKYSFTYGVDLPSKGYGRMITDGNYVYTVSKTNLVVIDIVTNDVKVYGKEYGFVHDLISIDKGSDGNLYIGSMNGYYTVDYENIVNYEEPTIAPVITDVKVDSESRYPNKEALELDHDENFLKFSFGSINYFNPEQESYRYRLDGLDDEWIVSTGERIKEYTDIRPAKYAFEVQVKTDGEWSESSRQEIMISPPWYDTLWARITGLLLLGLLVWLYFRYRMNREKAKSRVEKRFAELETVILKSQMNPHFLFNSLNSIRFLFLKGENKQGITYITKFAKLLRSSLHLGETPLVTLGEELDFTKLYIEMEQLRFDNKIKIVLEESNRQEWEKIPIPPYTIQPLVENASWHGLYPSENEEKILNLSLSQTENNWTVTVEDNGVGYNPSSKAKRDENTNKKKSYGLKLIKERFQLLNKTQEHTYALDIRKAERFPSGTRAEVTISKVQS